MGDEIRFCGKIIAFAVYSKNVQKLAGRRTQYGNKRVSVRDSVDVNLSYTGGFLQVP